MKEKKELALKSWKKAEVILSSNFEMALPQSINDDIDVVGVNFYEQKKFLFFTKKIIAIDFEMMIGVDRINSFKDWNGKSITINIFSADGTEVSKLELRNIKFNKIKFNNFSISSSQPFKFTASFEIGKILFTSFYEGCPKISDETINKNIGIIQNSNKMIKQVLLETKEKVAKNLANPHTIPLIENAIIENEQAINHLKSKSKK